MSRLSGASNGISCPSNSSRIFGSLKGEKCTAAAVTSTPDKLESESEAAMLQMSSKTLDDLGSHPNTALCQTTRFAPNLNVRSIRQSGLCLNTPGAEPEGPERERESKLPDSGAKFCSSRLARPNTLVFRIAEGSVRVLAEWQRRPSHGEVAISSLSIRFCLSSPIH